MEREENFATTLGIDTPASRILWEKINEPDVSDRERKWYIKYIAKYYFILNRIDREDFDYLSKLHLEYYLHQSYACGSWEELHYSLLANVMGTMRKIQRRKLEERHDMQTQERS